MKTPMILSILLSGCASGDDALTAAEELLLSATTGGEEAVAYTGDTLSPDAIPDAERPDPFRTCDAEGTYTGLFEHYDADGDGRLDAPESDDVMAARDGRSGLEQQHAMAQWALLLTIYDTDGSGALEESERATLLDDFTTRCGAIQDFLLATYDADGDGELSESEEATARAAMEAEMGEHAPPEGAPPEGEGAPPDRESGGFDGPPPAGEAPPIPPPLLDEFDTDADGQLSDAELTVLRDTMRERIRSGDPMCGM